MLDIYTVKMHTGKHGRTSNIQHSMITFTDNKHRILWSWFFYNTLGIMLTNNRQQQHINYAYFQYKVIIEC